MATVIALFVLLTAVSQAVSGLDPRPAELAALLTLKGEWGGSFYGSDTWQAGGTWMGIQVDGTGAVVAIELPVSGISGNLTSTLKIFQSLETFDVRSNSLAGPIPADVIASWQSLKNLLLAANSLSGPIPAEVFGLPLLESLDLSSNQISSGIPNSIRGAVKLTSLDLSYNRLTGGIPPGLVAGGKSLQWLWLSNNRLRGNIPGNIYTLNGLQVLDLSSNQLSGAIPTGFWAMPSLIILSLGSNRLMGRVPSDFSRIGASLSTLSLANNFLTGPLPAFSKLALPCDPFDPLSAYPGCYVLQTTIDFSNNYFYGPPTLTLQVPPGYAGGPATALSVCPQSDESAAERVSVTGNCLDYLGYTGAGEGCYAGDQRGAEQCGGFCGTGVPPGGQCSGHGDCIPWSIKHNPPFSCHCRGGYKSPPNDTWICTL